MKKLIQKISFASLMLFATTANLYAVAAPEDSKNTITIDTVCKLVSEMGSTFHVLRALAFIGAAFIIAGWAWGYISSGKVELKDVKEKGVGMLVGFGLLFSIGLLMSLLSSSCNNEFSKW